MATQDDVTLNAGVNDVGLNANADDVILTTQIDVVTGGKSVLNAGYVIETGGFYRQIANLALETGGRFRISQPFAVEMGGVSQIFNYTFTAEVEVGGRHKIVNAFAVVTGGQFGMPEPFQVVTGGEFPVGVKTIDVVTGGEFAILTGDEDAIQVLLDDFKASAAANPDAVAVTKTPKILTAKVWEEQSVDMTLKFRKADGGLPNITSMQWDLKTLDGGIVNGRDDEVVVNPQPDQPFNLAGDDLVLIDQNNNSEWRDLVVTATYDPENGDPDEQLVETVRFAVCNVGSVT
jgi:hypothetical protein